MGVPAFHRITNAEQLEPLRPAVQHLRTPCDKRLIVHRAKVFRLRFQIEIHIGQRLRAVVHHHLIIGLLVGEAETAGEKAGQAEHDQRYYEELEKTSQQYQAAFHTRQLYTQKALKAENSAASARLVDARETVERNLELFVQGAVSGAVVASSKAQLASLQGAAESVRSQLRITDADVSAASNRVYLDPDQLRMFDLAAQMTTLKLSLENQARNRVAYQQELDNLKQLIESEQQRVRLTAGYDVIAYSAGTVQELLAPQGTLVQAGSTLLRATDCGQSYVIAVFPERMASKIDRDSVLTVKMRGLDEPLRASVVQLLSSASDMRANTYSVPFPYAEQNSVYVVGTFAADLTQAQRTMTCNPGLWASAEVSRR